MKMFHPFIGNKYKLLIYIFIIFKISCSHYTIVKENRNFSGHNSATKEKIKNGDVLKQYRSIAVTDKSYPVRNFKFSQVYSKRYFAQPFLFFPAAEINNKAVELALDGRYPEAAILFTEAIKEDAGFSEAYNNLGIIYEFENKADVAFNMYSKACLIEPGNIYYRMNFLYFCDKKQ